MQFNRSIIIYKKNLNTFTKKQTNIFTMYNVFKSQQPFCISQVKKKKHLKKVFNVTFSAKKTTKNPPRAFSPS